MFRFYKYNFDYKVPGSVLKSKCVIRAKNKKAYADGLRDAINAMRRERDALLKTNSKKGNK